MLLYLQECLIGKQQIVKLVLSTPTSIKPKELDVLMMMIIIIILRKIFIHRGP